MLLTILFSGEILQTRRASMKTVPTELSIFASQLKRNASSVNAELIFLNDEITSEDLQNIGLLFIYVPTSLYSNPEVEAITNFLEGGGAIFIAMDVDGWSTLEQTNLNVLIKPFGIQLGPDSPGTRFGALTKEE